MSKPKKPRVRAVVDGPTTGDVGDMANAVGDVDPWPVIDAPPRRVAEVMAALSDGIIVRDVAAIAADPRPPYEVDLRPIHRAAEATGLAVTSLSVFEEGGLIVHCGPHVPPFTGATVAEIVALISTYNCKHCGTGGGHHPNCGRPR